MSFQFVLKSLKGEIFLKFTEESLFHKSTAEKSTKRFPTALSVGVQETQGREQRLTECFDRKF